jgi:hypothetical protein
MTWGAPFAIIFAGSERTVFILYRISYPISGIVELFVGQEGPNVDVSFRPFLICCLCIVNDRDEPVPVSPDVEHHIPVDVVGVAKHEPNFRKIVPSNAFDDSNPCLDFIRSIWMLLHGLSQMLARHNSALTNDTSQYVKKSGAIAGHKLKLSGKRYARRNEKANLVPGARIARRVLIALAFPWRPEEWPERQTRHPGRSRRQSRRGLRNQCLLGTSAS